MLADSTNATSEGWTPSESVINDAFDRVFSAAKGRVIVATFASLISRIQQVIDAAVKQNRKIAFAGHSMKRNVDMALDYNILRMPSGMMVDINQIDQFPASRIVIMATGAQGEPSSVLSRMAAGRHKLEVNPGDTIVISSHPIPGNEESVSRTINDLFRRGANVIYDPLEQVHVSGHGNREDMRLMLNLIRPQNLVPVHGELRHLIAHANLAVESGMQRENVFVIENGYVINLDDRGITIGERSPGGYVDVDGHGVGDIGRAVLRDREILAQDGFVTIIVDVERRNRRVLGNPEIISRGFVYLRDAEQLMEKISNTARVVIKGANGQTRAQLQSDVEGAVSQMLYSETHRRPMVFTVINER
jgi:ribonuclease J